MNVFINDLQEAIHVDLDALEQTALRLLEWLDCEEACELSLALVNDAEIHRLNLEYRGIDRSTDVLSFALQEAQEPDMFHAEDDGDCSPIVLGDVILSTETVERQAQEHYHGFERELYFLLIHGILHLLGYDHQTVEDAEPMEQLERDLLKKLSF